MSSSTSQIVTLPPLPELFEPNFLDTLIPVTQNAPAPEPDAPQVAPNAMMVALRSTAHQKLTANDAPTFSSTLVRSLDAYLGLRTGILGEQVDRYLENAWKEDPNLTLRIIWSTRSIHDGKAEKELFYRAFGWLFENHPRTAITNLHYLVDPVCLASSRKMEGKKDRKGASHGCWKDLLNILALVTVDELKPKIPLDPRSNFLHNHCDGESRPAFKNNEEQEDWSRAQRIERSHHAHDRLRQKLLDKHYRALYVAVARLFADQIANECDVMTKIAALPDNADKENRLALMHALTLVAKWAPTPGGSHDRITNIASAICLLLHEAHVFPSIAQRISFSTATTLQASEMHLLRCVYQQHVLTRGRSYACVPEPLMSSNRWSKIIYSRVPSICMNKNKEKFFEHDEDRFLNYLTNVELGINQISGATLLPHILAMQAMKSFCLGAPDTTCSLSNSLENRQYRLKEVQMKVIDAQWATLVARLWESGHLNNCIAVCDVSESMGSVQNTSRGKSTFHVEPIWPAISLSLLVARLARPPFNKLVPIRQLTFDDFNRKHLKTKEEKAEQRRRLAKYDWVEGELEDRDGGMRVQHQRQLAAEQQRQWRERQRAERLGKHRSINMMLKDLPSDDSFITFSASPEFVALDPESWRVSLGATINGMSMAKWEMNTDFNAVFLKLILPLAVRHNVPKDQMIKRIFVFSDMQFDSANRRGDPAVAATEWKTNHDVIAEAYAQAGYDVPELVYWDLSRPRDGHGITAPVTGEREGVALLSGYSPSLLKVFMAVGEEEEGWDVVDKEEARPTKEALTPEQLMKKALGRKSYDGLVVVD